MPEGDTVYKTAQLQNVALAGAVLTGFELRVPKFATADLIGVPWQLMVGPKGLAEGKVEIKRRADGTRENVALEDAVTRLIA